MTAEHSVVPLQSTCTRCGGNPPINFATPVVCPYCGGIDTLAPGILGRLMEVRRLFKTREAGLQQFNDQQYIFSMKYRRRVVRYLPFLFFFWTLTSLIFFGTAHELLGKDFSITGLVTLTGIPGGSNVALTWWFLYAAFLWFSFSFFIPSLSFFRARRIIEYMKPYAPHSAGEAPRCRNCWSPLPKSGTVRRCPACGTDHLVLDESYREEQSTLDEAVRDAMMSGKISLRTRVTRSENILGFAFLFVILSIFGAPLSGSVLSALLRPALWYYLIPLVLFGIFSAFYIRSWRRIASVLNRIGTVPAEDVPGRQEKSARP